MPNDSTLRCFTELLVYGKQKIKTSCIIYPEGHIRLVHIRRRRVISCHSLYSTNCLMETTAVPTEPTTINTSIDVFMIFDRTIERHP